jgi:hypothetical protein
MRRLLILLLVLVVPLKAWASVALPLAAGVENAGLAHVQHVGHMAQAHADHDDQSAHVADGLDTECCADHAAEPHSHECPHLTMPLLVPAQTARAFDSEPGKQPVLAAPRLASVVLDVLLPPPLPLL